MRRAESKNSQNPKIQKLLSPNKYNTKSVETMSQPDERLPPRLPRKESVVNRSVMWGGSRHQRESVTAIVTNALEREERQLDFQLQNYLGSSEKRIGILQENQQMSDACLDLDDLELELAMAEEALRQKRNRLSLK